MTRLIFANGTIDGGYEWIRPYIQSATQIIAANGGSKHLRAMGVTPQVVIGDLDSLPANIQSDLARKNVELITHPTHKDETDLELALEYAHRQGAEPILLFGLLGGRLDHMLGNLFLLTHSQWVGADIQLVTATQKARVLFSQGEVATTIIHGREGDTLSLIPLGGDVEMVDTQGLKWALKAEVLYFGPARGMSNIMNTTVATVTIRRGFLLCVHSYS